MLYNRLEKWIVTLESNGLRINKKLSIQRMSLKEKDKRLTECERQYMSGFDNR